MRESFENENGGMLTVTVLILLNQQIFMQTDYIYYHEIQSFFSRYPGPITISTRVIGYNAMGETRLETRERDSAKAEP